MSIVTRSAAQASAEVVRTETVSRANSAGRVGQLFRDIADSYQINLQSGTAQGQTLAWDVATGVYVPAIPGGLLITAFTPFASLVETGQTVSNPSFTSSQNTPPAGLVLTNN